MAKNNRGKILRKMPANGRGNCPLCSRTAAKLLWEVKNGDETINVCKRCRNRDAAKILAAE
ncbi:MAG: hypothetical protein CSB55_02870 [Candidatus Cloacimonadota bacterium]|nr:MAG: hypothetical protein CSB55_02870 [Candidatus Cloacimonadota bacterium]